MQLDWGGMVACNVNGDWLLRGVIGGINCLPKGNAAPVIVTDLEKFQSWIASCSANFQSVGCFSFPTAR